MDTSAAEQLPLGEVARRLGVGLNAVLELIYDGRLPAMVDRSSGRLLVDEADVERVKGAPLRQTP